MAKLTIPGEARCAIPGCRKQVTHLLSVRMRRQDTGADWAPNTEAFFCVDHATDGADVEVLYEPNESGNVRVDVVASRTAVSRTTRITKRNGEPI